MASSHCLLLSYLALLIATAAATQYRVGGPAGWTVPTAMLFNRWAKGNRFQIGDSLLFVYPPDRDSVLRVTQDGYSTCNTSSYLQRFDDGNTVFTFDKSGSYYFISGDENNCLRNEAMVVLVVADRSNRMSSVLPTVARLLLRLLPCQHLLFSPLPSTRAKVPPLSPSEVPSTPPSPSEVPPPPSEVPPTPPSPSEIRPLPPSPSEVPPAPPSPSQVRQPPPPPSEVPPAPPSPSEVRQPPPPPPRSEVPPAPPSPSEVRQPPPPPPEVPPQPSEVTPSPAPTAESSPSRPPPNAASLKEVGLTSSLAVLFASLCFAVYEIALF